MLLLVAFAAVTGGVVGGVTMDMLRAEPPAGLIATAPDRSESRFDALEAQVARLYEEVKVLRDAPVRSEPLLAIPRVPEAGDSEGAPEEALPAGSELEAKVEEIVEKKVQEEEAARAERRATRDAERDAERRERLAEELGLNEYQTEELGKILAESREAMRKLREPGSSSGERVQKTREQLDAEREQSRKIRDAANEKVKALLSSEQYETWTERTDRNRGGGQDGRRRR